ncbi:MAG: hypothetical protein HeimC3_34240 [Candidatus Heimdallarchaeota archaeon LC_3]|nr:MAG: hypothetical protein HeimC3_34240 [Candidatus Heimdallarchaeota archaeon LC_3]
MSNLGFITNVSTIYNSDIRVIDSLHHEINLDNVNIIEKSDMRFGFTETLFSEYDATIIIINLSFNYFIEITVQFTDINGSTIYEHLTDQEITDLLQNAIPIDLLELIYANEDHLVDFTKELEENLKNDISKIII